MVIWSASAEISLVWELTENFCNMKIPSIFWLLPPSTLSAPQELLDRMGDMWNSCTERKVNIEHRPDWTYANWIKIRPNLNNTMFDLNMSPIDYAKLERAKSMRRELEKRFVEQNIQWFYDGDKLLTFIEQEIEKAFEEGYNKRMSEHWKQIN